MVSQHEDPYEVNVLPTASELAWAPLLVAVFAVVLFLYVVAWAATLGS